MKLLLAVLPTILLTTYSQLIIKWRVATLATGAARSIGASERTFAYLLDPFIISADMLASRCGVPIAWV